MKAITRTGALLIVGFALLTCLSSKSPSSAAPSAPASTRSWDPKAAATYLDRRMDWWMSWPGAARDHQTFCISCHTSLPYAISRSALSGALGQTVPANAERRVLDNVIQRVHLWNDAKPFYGDHVGPHKAIQSRGTESVLNALILATSDSVNGELHSDTRAAFRNMWALQETAGNDRGAWPWLDFGLEPFEASDSVFYGAALAAIAVGTAPGGLRESPETRNYLKPLRDYLEREYTRQSLSNQAVLLWAALKLPHLLSSEQQNSIVESLLSKQRPDGGWILSSLAWTWRGSGPRTLVRLWYRSEDAVLEGKSDGYATGLIAYVLEQYDFPHRDDAHLQRALDWLRRNQSKPDGRWPGYSLNHPHEESPTGLFMTDAATAYAVLALTASDSTRTQDSMRLSK